MQKTNLIPFQKAKDRLHREEHMRNLEDLGLYDLDIFSEEGKRGYDAAHSLYQAWGRRGSHPASDPQGNGTPASK
ncbi:MAG: hypothetical protein GX481_08470 [Atopobium sp.]|nr:hypothetical protein [Atopobium sp.]